MFYRADTTHHIIVTITMTDIPVADLEISKGTSISSKYSGDPSVSEHTTGIGKHAF